MGREIRDCFFFIEPPKNKSVITNWSSINYGHRPMKCCSPPPRSKNTDRASLSVTEPSANSFLQYIDEDPDEDDPLTHPRDRISRRSFSGSTSSFLTTMDDLGSIYLDTISITSGSTIGNNRRSLALSRQTIYHSAEDVNEEEDQEAEETENLGYGYDLPDHPPGNGILKHSNGSARDQGRVSQDEVEHYARKLDNLEARPTDEVTALLPNLDEYGPVPSSHSAGHHLSNKTKKETITYSQWKARVNTEYDPHQRICLCHSTLCFTCSLQLSVVIAVE